MVVGYNRSHSIEEEVGTGFINFFQLFALIENIKEEDLIEFPLLNLKELVNTIALPLK